MERIRWYGPSVVLLMTLLTVMIVGPKVVRNLAYAQQDAHIQLVRNDLANNDLLKELSDAYAGVAEVVEPSVVHIEVLTRRSTGGGIDLGDLLFGPRGPRVEPREPAPQDDLNRYNPPTLSGNGAGWVFDKAGHIITNNHVVEGGDQIRVRLYDGSQHKATIVGADPRTDIAVLKIDSDHLHPAKLAPDPVRQGEIVFAFGSPFKFEFSMSQGIVSAQGRRLGITGGGGYENFIQTDAEINPGNSGGPLVNIYGQVVGMNTAIASRSGQFQGLGFAIPAKMVQRVADELIDTGKVSRGYLGVYIEELTPKMARTFGFEGEGVLVNAAIDGSPAAEAGFKAGDIITRINDQPVTNPDELRFLVAGFKPGEKIEVTLFRDKQHKQLTVTLAELPDSEMARAPLPRDEGESGDAEVRDALSRLGIESYQTFTGDMAEELGWDRQPGVAVARVRPGSVAANEGLRPGVVITAVMGSPVANAAELEQALDELDLAEPVRFTVVEWSSRQRTYISRFVVVEFPDA